MWICIVLVLVVGVSLIVCIVVDLGMIECDGVIYVVTADGLSDFLDFVKVGDVVYFDFSGIFDGIFWVFSGVSIDGYDVKIVVFESVGLIFEDFFGMVFV